MKILLAIDDSKFAEAAMQAAISQVRQDHTQVFVPHVVDWSNFMPSPFPRVGEELMCQGNRGHCACPSRVSRWVGIPSGM